ncbi:hypothetical protein JCM15519_07060 [Fundidesulfovibrio butyratiphilus]
MSERNKRLGAQDIVNQGGFVFGEPVAFEKAFPTIDTIKLQYEISFVGGFPKKDEYDQGKYTITDKKYIGEYIRCTNNKCYNGGFQIGWILRDMVRDGKTEQEGEIMCRGDEGSPKGRKIYRKCLNRCTYKISITFKTEGQTSA